MAKNYSKKVLSVCLALVITMTTCFTGISAYATDDELATTSSEQTEITRVSSENLNIARSDGLETVYSAESDAWMEGYGYTLDTLTDGDCEVTALFYASNGYDTSENTVSITMEFGGTYEINNITLTPRYYEDGTVDGFPEDFTINIKTSRGWQQVAAETGYIATSDKQVFDFASIKGTAVKFTASKLTADKSNGKFALYLREMEVYGCEAKEFDLSSENLANTKKPTIVSPEADPWGEEYEYNGIKPYCKESLYDGDTGTRYISAEVDSADSVVNITMEFDDCYEIANITLLPLYVNNVTQCFPEDFTISVRTKNGGWQTVVNESGYVASKGVIANADGTFTFDDGRQAFDFDAIVANQVRLTATKLSGYYKESVAAYKYALYIPEMEVYGKSIEYTKYNTNIALAENGTTVYSALADEGMFEYGYTPDALIDNQYGDTNASYLSLENSRPEDHVEIQLDFDGWYKMNNVSLKPCLENGIVVCFPEDFEISVQTENGWQTVLQKTGYQVAVLDMQSFDFEEISGNALKLTATKLTRNNKEAYEAYALYLTELQVYGETTTEPIIDDSNMNVVLTDGVEITASSHNSYMEENGFTIDKLIDNQYSAYGALGYFSSDDFWSADGLVEIELDLKKYYEIQQINLFPFWTDPTCATIKTFPVSFSFSVHTSAGWEAVLSVEDHSAVNGENAFTFDAVVGDGVKLTVTKLAPNGEYGNYCMALSEIQVWGSEAELGEATLPEGFENIAVGQHCVAGAVIGTDLDASYINDGDTENLYTGTSYTSAEVESREYVLLNLHKPRTISQIKFYTNYQNATAYGFPKDFKIRVYSDGEWTDVVEKTNFQAGGETVTFTFPEVNAQRVELVATVLSETESDGNYALQVKEVELYGKTTATAGTADLSIDYEVNSIDLDIMRKNLLGTMYSVLKSADCNSDDTVDVRDLVSLKKQCTQSIPKEDIASGKTYYVDSSVIFGGDGLSAETPLRTIDAVNALNLNPGDTVLFRRGQVWEGQLEITTSGTEDASITFGSYGTGDLPAIHGGGQYAATIYGENVSYITVKEIEVTNSGDTTGYHRGIYFCAKSRSSNGISIMDCYVHDVDSCLETISIEPAGLGDPHWIGGIVVRARSNEFPSGVTALEDVIVNDILIRNNTVVACMQTGIAVGGSTTTSGKKSTDICIFGNEVADCYGDGIILFNDHAGIIEGNISRNNALNEVEGDAFAGIWNVESTGDLIQYNESYKMNDNRDGQGFDIDGGCAGTLFQYNYSHDNPGGALLLMQNRSGSATIRYNISQNDSRYGINVAINENANVEPFLYLDIYNNVIYTQTASHMIAFLSAETTFATKHVGDVSRNIFYAYDGASMIEDNLFDYLTVSENIYYGFNSLTTMVNIIFRESTAKTDNPQFVNVGSAAEGHLSLGGYVLKGDSPYKEMGFMLPVLQE